MSRENVTFYNRGGDDRLGRENLSLQLTHLPAAGAVLEIGAGLGALQDVHPDHIALDISHRGLLRIRHARRTQADAERLPFPNRSISYVFSVATLEHVPRPDRVFEEIDRVLLPEGVAYLAPAWNCRSWTPTGVTVKPYSALPLRLKILKASLIIRERLAWRAMMSVLPRLLREVRRPKSLAFRPIRGNYTEYLTSDSDAAASIDPHAAILFFVKRRYDVLSHPTLKSRLLVRNAPVVVRKPPHET